MAPDPGALGSGLGPTQHGTGTWQFRASLTQGFGFDGSHVENHGIDVNGDVIEVPEHNHEVELDISRVLLQFDYTFEEPWGVRWRIPLERKSRVSALGGIQPGATAEEIEAMERNLQAHHATRNLTGFGDADVLLAWHGHDWGKEGATFALAAGTTVPLGRTEENPYTAGDAGEIHEHIQLGSGTYDPLVEFFYSRPLGDDAFLNSFGKGRFPGTENDEGYRAPRTVDLGVGYFKPIGAFGPWEDAHGNIALLYQEQGRAFWDGEIDPNTGFETVSASIGISWQDEDMHGWTLSLVVPISIDTPDVSAGVYEPGPIFSLGVGF